MESTVKFPWFREELIRNLKDLSDKVYQQRVWVDKIYPHDNFYDDFTQQVNFLGDAGFFYNPKDTVGDIVKNEKELNAVMEVVYAIDKIFNQYGKELSDKEYISLPEWQEVIEKAKIAKEIVK